MYINAGLNNVKFVLYGYQTFTHIQRVEHKRSMRMSDN
jgi:hypothetical protein